MNLSNNIIYDNYMKNEQLKITNQYESFLNKNKNQFLEFYRENSVIHEMIKYILVKNLKSNDDIICLTLRDLYDLQLFDFTIQFSDGKEFKCLKGLLIQIPYFSTIFEDTDVQHTITLNVNSDIAMIVLKLLYDQHSLFKVEYIIETIKLMDMWLMDVAWLNCLPVDQNIDEMIKLLIDHNQYYDIMILINNLE